MYSKKIKEKNNQTYFHHYFDLNTHALKIHFSF